MSTFRYIFLLIYFLFHALLLLGSIMTIGKIKESDFKFINGFINDENLFLNSSNLLTFTGIGLVLFGVNMIFLWNDMRREKNMIQAKDREIMALKAKLFDLHDSSGESGPAKEKLPPDADQGGKLPEGPES